MNPSIRTYLRRRIGAALGVALGAWLLIASTQLLDHALSSHAIGAVGLVGVVAFVGAILALNFAARCPKCSARMGQIAMLLVFSWGRRQRVNFCPFCGVNLDEHP